MFADWLPASAFSPLTAARVQIWSIDLNESLLPEAGYLRTLSADELERAARLRAGQVRMQFVVGRTCLRELLGAHLGIAPEKVPIVAGKYGKPEVGGEYEGRVHFNVAHARSTILVALSLLEPVGIDVEYLDRETDVLEVARHSLTERETSALLAIKDIQERHRAFFTCWTRKEAVVKADGRGLSLPLASFEVPVGLPCVSLPIEIASAADDRHTLYFLSDIALSDKTVCAAVVATGPVLFELRALPLQPGDQLAHTLEGLC